MHWARSGLVHPVWLPLVLLGTCFMWLKWLHWYFGWRLKSTHTAVVPTCSWCRTGAPNSCCDTWPAYNCDSLADVLRSNGRCTRIRFFTYPVKQHGEWRPAVWPVAGAPVRHDPVNGKSNKISSTEELKAFKVQTNYWQEWGRQRNGLDS